jgi:hypothetical protein
VQPAVCADHSRPFSDQAHVGDARAKSPSRKRSLFPVFELWNVKFPGAAAPGMFCVVAALVLVSIPWQQPLAGQSLTKTPDQRSFQEDANPAITQAASVYLSCP